MKRWMFAVSIAFSFGAVCSGVGGEEVPPPVEPEPEVAPAPEPVKEVVVVPVADDGKEHWCCAWDDAGTRKYTLLKGPAECRNRYAEKGGAWTEGPECTPCCCKTAQSDSDPSRGFAYELTTPLACAGVGECLLGEAKECAGQQEPPEPTPAPRPKPPGEGKGQKGKRPAGR